MRLPFLTDIERQHFGQVPSLITPLDLQRFFHLNEVDRQLIALQRRDANRLGFAIQLGLIRLMGFLPENWRYQIPNEALDCVSQQLQVDAQTFAQYGRREATRSTHLHEVLTYLRFKKWDAHEENALSIWLLERAMEHDQPRVLLDLACEKLRRERIMRPAIWTLEGVVNRVIGQTEAETYRRVDHLLTDVVLTQLDALLVPGPLLLVSPHRWLATVANANTAVAITTAIRKLVYLKELGVAHWEITYLNANLRKRMAQLARKRTNQALQRYAPQKRYPLLLVFLKESYLDLTDAILTMFGDFWEHIVAKAKREMDDYQQRVAYSKDQAMQTLGKAVHLIVDEEGVPDEVLRQSIFEQVSKADLVQALEHFETLFRPTRYSYLEFLDQRYGYIKQFSSLLLTEITFQNGYIGDDFGHALQVVIALQTGKRRKLPTSTPLGFMTPTWRSFVLDEEKRPVRRAYELCVLSTLRDRLRSGDIYVADSRKFADLDSYLIPAAQWESLRAEVCSQLGLPANPRERIEQRIAELESYLPLLDTLLKEGGEIRLEEGEVVITPLEAEEVSDSLLALEKEILARMPQVDLTELIVEVDSWTTFSAHLTGLDLSGTKTGKGESHQRMLYAALLATGCNIPLSDMARSTGLEYQTLWWTAHNYLREDTLRQANTTIVNYHHQHPLAASWGGGTLSSSDGQRFPVSGKVRNAKALPNYFGYGKGVTFYTHTSDQYSQYGSKVISATVRDATVVLDEILDNQTELVIEEHTTDTNGSTDIVFGLFDVQGLFFCPRIRDIKDQKLCKIKDKAWTYPELKFTGSINPGYIAHRWDDVLRLAGSFKLGYVTASLFISKLQSYPRQNNLTYVLQQYGQLIKTIYILRYLQSKPLRRKVNAQLNKGECLHAVRCFVWFGGDGMIRRKQEIDQQEAVSCLNLLTNLIVVWNTVYIQEIIQQLQREGYEVLDEDIAHLSPARYEHINRLGKYTFTVSDQLLANGLRPLRKGR